MVNSESVSNENSFEKLIHEFRNKGEGSFLVFVEGLSMYPLFESGSRVPVKLMPKGTEYEVGDIIVFKSFDSYIIHAVIDSYVYKGKTYYVTGGLNQETNPYVDCTTISSDHILGLADLSEEFLAGIPALESQGLYFEMKVYGMINQFDALLGRAQEIHERMANIDESNKEAMLDVLLDYMEVLIALKQSDIQNQEMQTKLDADIRDSISHISNNIFTEYSAELFEQILSKLIGQGFNAHNPNDINLDITKMKTMTKIIGSIDNFYGLDKTINELQNYGLFKNRADPDILIDQLTNEIWGKTYKQLLVDWCNIEQSTDQEYISKLEENGIKFTEEEIIWITKITNPSGEEVIVWLELGKHDYATESGNGLEHIYQKHTKDQFSDWGWKTPEIQAKKILDTINQKVWIKSRYDSQLGYSYIYDLGVINGVHRYLLIGIGDNGFIKSARPTQAPLFK
jgi:signal peptidase I